MLHLFNEPTMGAR